MLPHERDEQILDALESERFLKIEELLRITAITV
jgi:DeoR/GlpR family transcriptional regulator of sugar metabolism